MQALGSRMGDGKVHCNEAWRPSQQDRPLLTEADRARDKVRASPCKPKAFSWIYRIATGSIFKETSHLMANVRASLQGEDKMSNQIGERYVCSNASCGCEVEILRPARMPEQRREISSERRAAISAELSTPPSAVSEPRIDAGLEEGAGARSGSYGSPKLDEESVSRGPFRAEEEEFEPADAPAGQSSTTRINSGRLSCFCGSPMTLSSSRSSTAGAGKAR